MRDIIGHGGGKGGGSSHTHYEAPDSLHSTSYARVLDLVSEGEILGLAEGLKSVYLNDTPIQNDDGTSNFVGITVDFRTGTQGQDYIPGFPDVESETTVGVELKYGTPWVRAISNTALSAVRITLGVDQLHKANTDNGDIGGSIVNYKIELSTDGGAYQTMLSNSFNGKTMSAYQRSARIDLPRATSGWQIRVSRLTPNSAVVSVVDKTNIISYTEVIDAKLRYPMSALVGVQVDAKQFQSVPTRAYDLFGRIIQVPSNYDPRTRAYTGTWDGTFKPSWSDNPAWVFRDLALNDRYGLGNRITAAQLDKWALYKIARYCDELVPDGQNGTEPRFTCNLYLQTRKQAYAVLQDIASIFRGISYWGAGTIMASADMPSDPVYVYTAANVIGGKFTRTGTKKATRYTVALVTWNDPDDGYKPKVEYVEDREGIARYGIQQAELTAFGCASQGQAHRAGRWALATSRLETEGITFDVGMDGAIALPGQVVRIADPSRMGRRVGGRVRAVAGRAITLDKAPTVRAGDRLTVMMPAGVSETRTVASVAGDTVTVDSDWTAAPRAQAVWSVDSNELSAPLFRVLSVTEKDSATFAITAVQHEPGKYDFVENGTAITPRTQTALDVTRQAPPASVALAGYTVSLADVQKLALQVSCAPVAGAVAYEGAYRRGNDNWIAIPRQPSPTMDVPDILAGTYTAKMSAVNSIGVTSIEVLSTAVAIAKDGAAKNADVLLGSDIAYFHTDQSGNTDPSVITFTASLIALDGPVAWACVGGTLTNLTATTAQLTFANASAASVTVTASVVAYGRTYSRNLTIRKVRDGADSAPTAEQLKATLEGQITESQLYGTLRSRISLVDADAATAGSVAARVKKETDDRIAAITQEASDRTTYVQTYAYSKQSVDQSLSAQASTITAAYKQYADTAKAAAITAAAADVRNYSYSKADSDSALSAMATTLRSEFASNNGASTAWVQEYTYSKAATDSAISSSATSLTTAYKQYADNAKASAITTAAADVRNYSYSKSAADGALSSQATTLTANYQAGDSSTLSSAQSYVQNYAYSKSGADTAIAASTNTVTARLNSVGGTGVTVEQAYSAQATKTDALLGQYTVKIDSNGYIAGFGLSSSTSAAGANTSSFIINADKFAVVAPGVAPKVMFAVGNVNGAPTIGINGNTVIDGTLTVRATNGATVVDANGLRAAYAAPGTLNSDLTPVIDAAQSTANTAAARDVSNLVKKGNFDDGSTGGWERDGIENAANSGSPYKKNIWLRRRDAFEAGNAFPVTPGETLYFSAWFETTLTDYNCNLGGWAYDKNGQFAGASGATSLGPRRGWQYIEGSWVVPANSATVTPWIQMDGYSFDGNNQFLRVAGLWIGRHARGATVGAEIGRNLLGKFDKSNISTFIDAAAIGLALIDKASISSLAALSAYLGSAEIGAGGNLRQGQTAFHTGTGFWLGDSGGVPKFSIGKPGASSLRWDGTQLIAENLNTSLTPLPVSITTTGGNLTTSYSRNASSASTVAGYVNVTGGSGNYTYSWSVTADGYACWTTNPAGANCAGVMKGPGIALPDGVGFTLVCTVTDQTTGRTGQASFSPTIIFS
jgi:predicted phage tail protein